MTLIDYKEEHLFPEEQKLRALGDGPWIKEPDRITFEVHGYKCEAVRVGDFSPELGGVAFGGHWCGYVDLPQDHPWSSQDKDYIECDVHGGLTYSEHKENAFTVGFDCAHGSDIMPSLEILGAKVRSVAPEFGKIGEMLLELTNLNKKMHKLDSPTYKDNDFVIKQIESLAAQAHEAMME